MSDNESQTSEVLSELEVELAQYQSILEGPDDLEQETFTSDAATEELRMTPLVWWQVKEKLAQAKTTGFSSKSLQPFQQYGVLGSVVESFFPDEDPDAEHPAKRVNMENGGTSQPVSLLNVQKQTEGKRPVLLNTDAPWSVFLCGSQGSGKSHTLSCILENCLLTSPEALANIGKLPNPLAGLIFYYDKQRSDGICEAATLCTQIPTTILVSPSNEYRLKQAYKAIAGGKNKQLTIKPLRLLPKYLNTERVKRLMAVTKTGEMPLYMQVLFKILRDMAFETQGKTHFNYQKFKSRLGKEDFNDKQSGFLQMRIELLESFMATQNIPDSEDPLIGRPGTLTIIDLSDPVIDPDTACVLFDICLTIFVSQTSCGKVVTLDEAHNYMQSDSTAADEFTGNLLKCVREQRHRALRMVIATQEPTINTALLDLCTITMVFRCSSPAWFEVLKKHIAAIYLTLKNQESGSAKKAAHDIFQTIIQLRLGESLLFCTLAAVDLAEGGNVKKLLDGYVKFRTRKRISDDGGKTKLARDGGRSGKLEFQAAEWSFRS